MFGRKSRRRITELETGIADLELRFETYRQTQYDSWSTLAQLVQEHDLTLKDLDSRVKDPMTGTDRMIT